MCTIYSNYIQTKNCVKLLYKELLSLVFLSIHKIHIIYQ